MMPESGRKVAVVTGASGGIGRATALKLAENGYSVIAQYRSRFDAVELLRGQIEATGGTCWPVRADFSAAGGVNGFAHTVKQIADAHSEGHVHALVNSAARLLGPSMASATEGEFDSYFAVNVKTAFFLTQELRKWMPAESGIVNVSSAANHFSSPGDIIYVMTKAAIESFTKHAAQDLAASGIRINVVVPGFTDNGHPAFQDPEILAHMSSISMLGGISEPFTVAEAIAFLLSDASRRTTGAVLDVSGGSTFPSHPRNSNTPSLRALAAKSPADQTVGTL